MLGPGGFTGVHHDGESEMATFILSGVTGGHPGPLPTPHRYRPRTAAHPADGRPQGVSTLIFITAKFLVKPEHADDWPQISRDFTEACRAEPGCKFYDWSRSLDDPHEYVLVEAFDGPEAGSTHVNSAHFKQAQQDLPRYLQATPKIISQEVDQDDWNELGELAVD